MAVSALLVAGYVTLVKSFHLSGPLVDIHSIKWHLRLRFKCGKCQRFSSTWIFNVIFKIRTGKKSEGFRTTELSTFLFWNWPSPQALCFPGQAAADGPSLLSAFASPAENSRVPGRHLSFARTIHFTSLGCKGLLAFNLQLNQPELSLAHAIRVFLPSQNLWELTQEVPSRRSCLKW